jgi:hypothetical protein
MPGIRVHLARNRCSRCPESVFIIPGIAVHVPWNRCSRYVGMGVHDGLESAFKIARNTHSAVLPHPVAIRLEQRRLNRLGLVLVDRSENSNAPKILVEGTNTFASISSKASFRAWAITLNEVTRELLKKLGRNRLQANVIVSKKRD